MAGRRGEETRAIASWRRRFHRLGAVGQHLQLLRATANLIEPDVGSNQPTGHSGEVSHSYR